MASTFNSDQYSWADVTVAFGGRIVEGITKIEYVKKQATDYLYGRGDDPHNIVAGNNEYEGTMTLWQSELEAMTRDAPSKDILKLRPDIIIAYSGGTDGQTVTDILKGVRFGECKKGMSQGDKNMLVELPFKFIKILPQQ